jgi:predicted DNA-binding protein (UPF0251 family)
MLFPNIMNQTLLAQIVMLRGLGYSQNEIAGKLEVSQPTIHNHLKKIRKQCDERGTDAVFCQMLLHNRIDPDSIIAIGEYKFKDAEGRFLRERIERYEEDPRRSRARIKNPSGSMR